MSAALHPELEISSTEDGELISRFTIAILSSLLIGTAVGRQVPQELSSLSLIAGALGLAGYAACAASAARRKAMLLDRQQLLSEGRLRAISLAVRWRLAHARTRPIQRSGSEFPSANGDMTRRSSNRLAAQQRPRVQTSSLLR